MKITTKYYIDYVDPIDTYGHKQFYHQLVRTRDEAILYSAERLIDVEMWCWHNDIKAREITIL